MESSEQRTERLYRELTALLDQCDVSERSMGALICQSQTAIESSRKLLERVGRLTETLLRI